MGVSTGSRRGGPSAGKPRLARLLVFAAMSVLAASLVALGALTQASAADEDSPPQPPVAGISYCDFVSARPADSRTPAGCRAALLDPPGARVVDKLDAAPSPATLAAASAESAPPPSASSEAEPAAPGSTDRDLTDLDPSAAAAVFDETARPVVKSEAPPKLPDGADVLAGSGSGAVVRLPGEDPSLIDSTAPVVDATGRPIDLQLHETDSGLKPDNATASLRLPAAGDGSARLADAGVSISYSPAGRGAAADADAHLVGELGALYPTVDTDTDLFLAPRAAGFEVFAQLRSAESPDELRFAVDMPNGDSLEPAPGPINGAQIVDADGKPVVTVTPPVAMDANGDSVAAHLAIEGNSIAVHVPHGAADAYPILVDPDVNDVYAWSSGAGFTGWYAGSGTVTEPDYQQFQNLYPNTGLWNYVPSGKTLTAGSLRDWYYLIPHYGSTSSTYISNLWMKAAFSVGGTSQGRPKVAMGEFRAPGGGWVRWKSLSGETPLTGGWFSNPATEAGALTPSWNTPLETGMSQTQATRADFQLYTTDTGITTDSNRAARLDTAWVQLNDTDNPIGGLTGLSGWVDGADSSYTITAHPADAGLGVKSVSLIPGQDENGDYLPSSSQTSSCTGAAGSPCPQSGWAPSFTVDPDDLRDGLQASWASLTDVVGHTTLTGSWFGVDRTNPVVTGAYFDPVSGDPDHVELHATASDGDPGSRNISNPADLAGAGSGVTSLKVVKDGVTLAEADQTCEGDGIDGNGDPQQEVPWGSCDMSWDTQLDATDLQGGGVVEVVATDAAGNESTLWNVPSTCSSQEAGSGSDVQLYAGPHTLSTSPDGSTGAVLFLGQDSSPVVITPPPSASSAEINDTAAGITLTANGQDQDDGWNVTTTDPALDMQATGQGVAVTGDGETLATIAGTSNETLANAPGFNETAKEVAADQESHVEGDPGYAQFAASGDPSGDYSYTSGPQVVDQQSGAEAQLSGGDGTITDAHANAPEPSVLCRPPDPVDSDFPDTLSRTFERQVDIPVVIQHNCTFDVAIEHPTFSARGYAYLKCTDGPIVLQHAQDELGLYNSHGDYAKRDFDAGWEKGRGKAKAGTRAKCKRNSNKIRYWLSQGLVSLIYSGAYGGGLGTAVAGATEGRFYNC